jgi:hypothetical protein
MQLDVVRSETVLLYGQDIYVEVQRIQEHVKSRLFPQDRSRRCANTADRCFDIGHTIYTRPWECSIY